MVSRDSGSGFQALSGAQVQASAPSAYGFSTSQRVVVSSSFRGLFYGDPELGKTLAGLLGLMLVSWTYVAIGVFASSLTSISFITR